MVIRYSCRKCFLTLCLGCFMFVVLVFNLIHNQNYDQKQNTLDCNKNIVDYNEDDPCLVNEIRYWQHGKLHPMGNYSFYSKTPQLDGQIGVPPFVDKILRNKTNGFYIECGAADGEEGTNTLYFEIKRNWKGLLIEPNKNTFKKLLNKNRNAIHINSCLSNTKKPQKVEFINPHMDQLGGVVGLVRENVKGSLSEEICLPLYSILLSIGNPTVDYFSLDVEGAEMGILESIPWDKVDIRVISVEVQHLDKKAVTKFMKSVGYFLVKRAWSREVLVVQDHIYWKEL